MTTPGSKQWRNKPRISSTFFLSESHEMISHRDTVGDADGGGKDCKEIEGVSGIHAISLQEAARPLQLLPATPTQFPFLCFRCFSHTPRSGHSPSHHHPLPTSHCTNYSCQLQ
ncbi:lysozyme C-like [Platysternon megacephalum]|uniref:Lysozyme C-like n=1 Tax=Platysternon megacephalum TaxID=55544 RepID=A0A4D9DMX9_9SAUR|nr:lysozyme C-like [Platysternon megacephalum]